MEKDKVSLFDEIVVIGGSAGSLEVLLQILPSLKTDIAVPIVIVLHRKVANDSPLVEVLAGKTSLTVKEVDEKEDILPGMIYLAPADYHLLFEADHTFSLDVSEKVNYSRPSIDVAFESAAETYSSSVIGILLSGANGDGTEGFRMIREMGGTTIAQRPDTAEISYMPEHAIQSNVVDIVMSVADIASYLNEL